MLIDNVNVWDGTSDHLQNGMNVLVGNNLIKKISKSAIEADANATVIDGGVAANRACCRRPSLSGVPCISWQMNANPACNAPLLLRLSPNSCRDSLLYGAWAFIPNHVHFFPERVKFLLPI